MSGPGSAGDVWISTLHTSGPATLAAAHAAWVTCVTALFNNALKTIWTPATQISDLETVALSPTTGRQTAAVASGTTLIGTETGGQAVSPRDCIVISKRTVIPTKAGRGRMYIPGPSAAHLGTSGLLLGTLSTSLAAAFAAAFSTLKATSTPVVYHHASKTTDEITQIKVGQVLGSQTRRTNRVFNAYAGSVVS
jgi:hypothetical protein